MGLAYVVVLLQFIASTAMFSPALRDCGLRASETRVVRVRFYRQSHFDERPAGTILRIANSIWAPYGVVIETAVDGPAINVIIADALPSSSDEGLATVIGTTMFSNGHATPNIHLSVGAAQRGAEFADGQLSSLGARPVVVVDRTTTDVLGIALAHELAHYLLRMRITRPRGYCAPALTCPRWKKSRSPGFPDV